MKRLSMPAVVTAVLVSSTLSLPAAAQPTAAPARKFELSRVKVEPWNGVDPKYDATPPLFVVGGWPFIDTLICEYQCLVRGQAFAGSDSLCGYLGRGYPASGRIVAERFEQVGNEFRLELRYVVPRDPPKEKMPDGWGCHIAAQFPQDLPDGSYRITVKVHDLPREFAARSELATTFVKPDELTTRRKADLAALEKSPLAGWVERYRSAAAEAPLLAACYDYDREPFGMPVRYMRWGGTALVHAIRRRIVEKKSEASPLLLQALAAECIANPEPERDEPPRGVSHDLMKMLVEIGDARAAPLLVAILSGEKGSNTFVRRAALETLEELTYVRFRRRGGGDWYRPRDEASVAVNDFVVFDADRPREEQKIAFQELGRRYAKWLAEHPATGSDRTAWLKAAAKRGREWILSDELELAYGSACFLRSDSPWRKRDDDPAATTDAIAAFITKRSTPEGEWSGPTPRDLPFYDLHDWLELLVDRGLPERHVPLLFRFESKSASIGMWGNAVFDLVGGKRTMEYRLAAYRSVAAELQRHQMDPYRTFAADEEHPLRDKVVQAHSIRAAIQRWAGRAFASDAELEAWWTGAKDRTQREWLEESLPILAVKADAGDIDAQQRLRALLDQELPNPPNTWNWNFPGIRRDPPPQAEPGPPFRVEWLRKHRAELEYVAERGVFRLPKPATVAEP